MKPLNFFERLFLTKPRTRIAPEFPEPAAIAHTLDADRLSSILRSAEAGHMADLFSLYRDMVGGHGHIQSEFQKRKLAVIGDAMRVVPDDEEDEAQVQAAEAIAAELEGQSNWLDVLLHLLDSTLYPLSVVEKIYRPSTRPGWNYELAELRLVPYRLLDFSTGELKLKELNERGMETGGLREVLPAQYIVHRGHALTSVPDTWGGPMRAVAFWYLFSVMDRSWWTRFLDRFGAPFMEAKYQDGDDAARATLSRAFSQATKLFGIAVPNSVELVMHQANATGAGDAFEKFHSVANEELSKAIIGQTSVVAKAQGLGSGQSEQAEGVRQDVRQFDAMRLGHTLRTQLVRPLFQLNGWAMTPPSVQWGGVAEEEAAVAGDVISALFQAGIRPTDEGVVVLSTRLGVPLERIPALPQPGLGGLSALAAPERGGVAADRSQAARDAVDAVAAKVAPDLSKALGETLSPLAALVGEATSLGDLEARLRAAIPTLDYSRGAQLAEAALVAASVNAASNFREL